MELKFGMLGFGVGDKGRQVDGGIWEEGVSLCDIPVFVSPIGSGT